MFTSLAPSWTWTMSLQCPELWMIPRAADTRDPQNRDEVTHPFFTLPKTFYTRSLLPPPINFVYPQGPFASNSWERLRAEVLLQKPDWQEVLQLCQPWEHSLSSPVYCKGTGGWSLSHHALCQKETPRSGRHPSLGSLFVLLYVTCDVFGLRDSNRSTKWEVVNSSKNGQSPGIGNILLCPQHWVTVLYRTTYQCRRVKT